MNFAVIGTGWITEAFINAAKQVDDLSLFAVYSRSAEKAKKLANQHGAETIFTDLEQMAANKKIDFIYIASPNMLHYEQAVTLLQHKKHVICEKPVFTQTAKWDRAQQIAKANDVFLVEALRNVYMPNIITLREHLNKAGTLRQVVLNYAKYSSRYDQVLAGEEPNIFSLDYAGGALVDLGVYPLAVARYLFGKPDHAVYTPTLIRTGVDGAGTLVLTYPDFVCTIVCSKISTSVNPSEMQGEKGTFTIDNMGSIGDVRFHDGQSGQVERVGADHAEQDMFYEANQFVKMIQNNDQATYQKVTQISRDILEVTEKVRADNGIIFADER